MDRVPAHLQQELYRSILQDGEADPLQAATRTLAATEGLQDLSIVLFEQGERLYASTEQAAAIGLPDWYAGTQETHISIDTTGISFRTIADVDIGVCRLIWWLPCLSIRLIRITSGKHPAPSFLPLDWAKSDPSEMNSSG
jgi:hypothetical protein